MDRNDSNQDTCIWDNKRSGNSKRYRQVVKNKGKFKDNVAKMNGPVLQTHTEARKPRQFDKSLEALKILAATEYKKDIKDLDTLFRNLEKPCIPIPVLPVAEVVKNQDSYVQQGRKSNDENQSS